MTQRDKLIELLDTNCGYVDEVKADELADLLLENGVIVLGYKDEKSGFYKCENCRHLSPSEITNRLFCTYHSEGENWYETYKDDYCSDFERKEKSVEGLK